MPRRPMTPEDRARKRETNRASYQRHREAILQRRQEQQRARLAQMTLEECEAHRENKRAYDRAWKKTRYHQDPERIRAERRTSYHANRDNIRARDRARRLANREHARAMERAYRTIPENAEKHRRHSQSYYWRNREQRLAKERLARPSRTPAQRAKDNARSKQQRERFPELVAQRLADWERRNPDKRRLINRRRRARKQSAPQNDLTVAQQQAVIAAAQGVCPYCPVYNPGCQACRRGTHKLTIDHITPLVHGGSHTLHNLIACCRRCNGKKFTGTSPVPVQPLLL